MAKKTVFLFLIALSFSFLPPVFAQDYVSERITDFHSDIAVQRDASMTVTETIQVLSSAQQIRHGIYRDFPTRYKDKYGNNIVVGFRVLQVLRDGRPEDYHFADLTNGRRIYIGKSDVVLPPGGYTYTLVYETNRQLGFYKDFDQLYWNVTGNGWAFPINRATASVRLPDGAQDKVIALDGYTGYFGQKGSDFVSSTDSSGDIIFETTRPLGPKEGLTVVVSWPKGYVQEPSAAMKAGYFIQDNRSPIAGIIGLLVLLAYYLSVWSLFGRDPAKGAIIPLYYPPEGFSPADARYIMKMGYDNKAIAALVINLAVKGYLKIEEEQGVFKLRRAGEAKIELTKEEEQVAIKLFGGSDVLNLVNTNYFPISCAISELKHQLKESYESKYFFTNIQHFVPGVLLSFLPVIVMGFLQPVEKICIVVFMSAWLTGWTFGLVMLLQRAISLWKNFGQKPGSAIGITLFAVPFLIGEFFGIGTLLFSTSVLTIVILAAAVGINFLFYHLLKAPTLAGRKVMDRIEGFKMFLSVTETERLNFLNPPGKTPDLFEKYLSYALALDVEQAWAQQFSDVLNQATSEGGQGYSPAWYLGPSWQSFGAGGFASGFGSSFSSAISSSSVAPGSSSGGGGGGSSGGGGGGGGGGGW